MPKITIERPHEWANQSNYINIYIDGEKVGAVAYADTMNFEITPGKHIVVTAKMKSIKSKPLEVDLSNNEDKIIRISTCKFWVLLPLAFTMILAIIFLILFLVLHFEYYILMVLFIALPIPLYKATFGRKNNLKLKQVD